MSIEIKESIIGREMNLIAGDIVLTRLQENGNLFCFGSKIACENIAKRYADKELILQKKSIQTFTLLKFLSLEHNFNGEMTMTIAETIAEQLGGRLFVAMTGAIFFSQDGGDTLLVRFKGSKKANILEVKLNGKDLYDMTFRKMRGTKLSLVEIHNDIYCDQLESIFEQTTGLYTHL